MLSLFWQFCNIIRLIFIVANGQTLKNNLTILSHCSWSTFNLHKFVGVLWALRRQRDRQRWIESRPDQEPLQWTSQCSSSPRPAGRRSTKSFLERFLWAATPRWTLKFVSWRPRGRSGPRLKCLTLSWCPSFLGSTRPKGWRSTSRGSFLWRWTKQRSWHMMMGALIQWFC